MFELHPQLARDTVLTGRFPLCELRLMNDSHYPWFILVPQRENLREIHELNESDLHLLMREAVTLSRALTAAFAPDKLNIAALGNVVPQLHIHYIARYTSDPAWPAPVWGKVPAVPYAEDALAEVRKKLFAVLGRRELFVEEPA